MTSDNHGMPGEGEENPFESPIVIGDVGRSRRSDAVSVRYRKLAQRALVSLRCTLAIGGLALVIAYGLGLWNFGIVADALRQKHLDSAASSDPGDTEEMSARIDLRVAIGKVILGAGAALGVAMFAGAFIVHAAPKLIAFASLGAFAVLVGISAMIGPFSLNDGIVVKLFVLCILLASVKSAFSYVNNKRYLDLLPG